jgi:hypothetical protein
MWETVVGITGIYSGVGGRGEPAERGELTAEEAAGMICAKCELGFTLDLVSLHCWKSWYPVFYNFDAMQVCLLSKEFPHAMHMGLLSKEPFEHKWRFFREETPIFG